MRSQWDEWCRWRNLLLGDPVADLLRRIDDFLDKGSSRVGERTIRCVVGHFAGLHEGTCGDPTSAHYKNDPAGPDDPPNEPAVTSSSDTPILPEAWTS